MKKPPPPVELLAPTAKKIHSEPVRRAPMPELEMGGFTLPSDNRARRAVPGDAQIRSYRGSSPASKRRRKPPPRKPAPRRKRGSSFRMPKISPGVTQLVVAIIMVAAFVVSAGILLSNLTNYNAFAVYLGGHRLGYIQYNSELTSESFHNSAVVRLEAQRGAAVRVNEVVTITATRATAAERMSRADMEVMIARTFTYTVNALAIYVHGEPMALLRNQREVDEVFRILQEPWMNRYTTLAEFVQPVDTRTREVSSYFEDFDSTMNATAILERAVYQYYFYTVVGGDNLEIIARRFGTNVARIKSDNNLPSHIIHPGQVLMLYRELPLLTIRTFDDHISDTTAPMETETVENENLNLAVANITTPGSPALVRATLRIVRVNGVEVDRYYLAPQIIEPGVTEIIEIGTGDAEVDIRN